MKFDFLKLRALLTVTHTMGLREYILACIFFCTLYSACIFGTKLLFKGFSQNLQQNNGNMYIYMKKLNSFRFSNTVHIQHTCNFWLMIWFDQFLLLQSSLICILVDSLIQLAVYSDFIQVWISLSYIIQFLDFFRFPKKNKNLKKKVSSQRWMRIYPKKCLFFK